MLFLGFSAGLPFLLVFSTLNARLADVGVQTATIGFFSWLGITYSIKVFWAPIVDRLKLPILDRLLGKRRSWILLAQAGIATGLYLMANVDPVAAPQTLALFGLLVAFSSATQDVAIDAYRIEIAEERLQAALAATYIFWRSIGASGGGGRGALSRRVLVMGGVLSGDGCAGGCGCGHSTDRAGAEGQSLCGCTGHCTQD
jgi:MFS family permease